MPRFRCLAMLAMLDARRGDGLHFARALPWMLALMLAVLQMRSLLILEYWRLLRDFAIAPGRQVHAASFDSITLYSELGHMIR